jgi:hypothetical protein
MSPKRWHLEGKIARFEWYGEEGANPFAQ